MNILRNDIYIKSLSNMLDEIDISYLQGKTLLISGAYGMIGSCIVDALMLWNNKQTNPCKIITVGRDEMKAKKRFQNYYYSDNFEFYCHDICEELADIINKTDYIIHAASNADPVNISRKPVDTLLANILGTNNLLKYGIGHDMQRFMYVSSGEMYGEPDDKMNDFNEKYCGYIDYSSPRSCYPSGKRGAEVLCKSYISQHNVNAVIVRPCHIFGPTMTENDSRAVSEFFKNAVKNKKIILKSSGAIERSHCYVIDAIKAIFIVLQRGLCGEAYNIADKTYQMTIKDFATSIAKASGSVIEFADPSEIEKAGYSKVKRSVLSNDKLRYLGWIPNKNRNAIVETIKILEKEC